MATAPRRSFASLPLLPLLFLISGFSSLLLEITWARRLSQLTGSGVRASGGVAAVTLAGLALGSYLVGRQSQRVRSPLRAYAMVEFGIALWALGTPVLSRHLTSWTAVLQAGVPGGLKFTWSSLLAGIFMVLPGALLMGATTPLMVQADTNHASARRRQALAGQSLGRLYAWNTLGAAAGALGAAFLVLPALGLSATCRCAAGIGCAVAAIALVLARAEPARAPGLGGPSGQRLAGDQPRDQTSGRIVSLVGLTLAGILGALCQVGWTRLLVLFFGSSVQALGLTLAACLAGLAMGSGWCARRLNAKGNRGTLAARISGLTATLTLLTLPFWGNLPVLLTLAQGWLGASFTGAIALQALFSVLLILPPAAAFGALLPALTDALGDVRETTGRAAGLAYALDSAGAVAGGLLGVFLFLPRLGVESLLRWTVMGEILLFVALAMPSPLLRSQRWMAFALALVLGGGAVLVPVWDPVLLTSGPLLYSGTYIGGGMTWKGVQQAMHRRGELVFVDEGPDATVSVRRGPAGNLSLQINGKTDASDGGDLPAQILAGEIPALLHPAPLRTLVIGLASGTTAGALAHHPVRDLLCIEISPGVTRAAAYFKAANGGVLSDPRFHLILGDGRVFLQQSHDAFDLIVSQPTNPWVAGVTNLFTREFFQTARGRLAPGGILAVWVQGYAFHPDDFRSLVGTFQAVFPDAQLWEESAGGGDYYLLGQRGGELASLGELASRLGAPGAARSVLEAGGISGAADLLTRYIASAEALRRFSRGSPLITDDNVRLEFSAPREIWKNRLPELLASLEAIRQSPATIFPAILDPSNEALRVALAERERGRRDRMRLALSIRRQDLEALASPALAAGLSLVRTGHPEEALPFLRRAREEAPEAGVVPLLLGWILLKRESTVEAEQAFRQAQALDPVSPEAAQGLGLSLYRMGRLPEAAQSFRTASTLAPGDPDPLANLGAVLLAQGQDREALASLDRALAIDPTHLSARINRGVALARQGRLAEAIQEYEAALAQDPLSEDARYNLRRARERGQDKRSSTP